MGAVFLGDAHGVQIDHEGWLAVSDAIDWPAFRVIPCG